MLENGLSLLSNSEGTSLEQEVIIIIKIIEKIFFIGQAGLTKNPYVTLFYCNGVVWVVEVRNIHFYFIKYIKTKITTIEMKR